MPAVRPQLVKRVFQPPYSARDATTFAFVLSGNAISIRDKVIRPALGNNYDTVPGALGGLFMLSWVEYAGFSSQSAVDSPRGDFTFKESALCVLVQDNLGDQYIYIPSLYLDTNAPELTGREVYGFPKSAGKVTIPSSAEVSNGKHLKTRSSEVRNYTTPPVFPIDSLVYEAWASNPLGNPDPLDVFDLIEEAFDEISSIFEASAGGDLQSVMTFLKTFMMFQKPLIFIKQLPSSVSGSSGQTTSLHEVKASFALNGAPTINPLNMLKMYKVRINDYPSAPLASAFGVASGAQLIPLAAVEAKLSYTLGHGTETAIP